MDLDWIGSLNYKFSELWIRLDSGKIINIDMSGMYLFPEVAWKRLVKLNQQLIAQLWDSNSHSMCSFFFQIFIRKTFLDWIGLIQILPVRHGLYWIRIVACGSGLDWTVSNESISYSASNASTEGHVTTMDTNYHPMNNASSGTYKCHFVSVERSRDFALNTTQ